MDILSLSEHIRILEELLLHQDFSNSADALEAMLADDFREISREGSEVSRDKVIAWLLSKSPDARWEFSGFDVKQLAPDLVLATYHARQIIPDGSSSKGAVHSSLWKEGSENKWQLLFHQSTRVL